MAEWWFVIVWVIGVIVAMAAWRRFYVINGSANMHEIVLGGFGSLLWPFVLTFVTCILTIVALVKAFQIFLCFVLRVKLED